jgi:iron(III) transport system substrate-binding protein
MKLSFAFLIEGVVWFASSCAPSAPPKAEGAAKVVNVYTSRHYDSDNALFDQFKTKTGIDVQVLSLEGPQLLERLKAEGALTNADLILTVDAGNLYRLQAAGAFQPVSTEALTAAVPDRLHEPTGLWWGVSRRARVIAYAKDRYKPGAAPSMDDLAKPALKGKVCARTSTNVYNLSLLSARIERDGADKAKAWAAGVAKNLARPPQGSDTDQLKAVAAGVCDVAIVNHYYLPRLRRSTNPDDAKAAAALEIAVPDQTGAGAHVNVSGAGVSAHAKNKDNAIALLEFLVSPEAQTQFASMNDEFPVRADVPLPPDFAPFKDMKEETVPLGTVGARQQEAQTMYDSVGWK